MRRSKEGGGGALPSPLRLLSRSFLLPQSLLFRRGREQLQSFSLRLQGFKEAVCFPDVGIADHRICIRRSPSSHSSQWTSHVAADQNCLLKKTDSCDPSENNYIQISRGRPWDSPCTLATRTPGPESNCLHQTIESPPKANPASA